MLARIFGFPRRRRVLNHARVSRGAKGKGKRGGGQYRGNERRTKWRWSETLGGHTVNRVLPPPRGSWPETIHSRGNLEDGTNERFSVSASNCE